MLLKVDHLKKYFPVTAGIFRRQVASVKAVNDVSFHLKEGEVLGIVGESGSGKSTIARAAIRLIEPTEGSIQLLNNDLLSLNKSELRTLRKHFQMIFQDPYASLNPRKTIGESIGEPLRYHGLVKNKTEQEELVKDVLERVGLSASYLHRYPHQFSGGQQQRICIGRAIALKPKLVVCDEALSALDVSVQAQVMNLLIELQQTLGLSYLFISHDLSVIRHVSDRVLVLYLGKVMEMGSTEAVFNNPKHPYTQALLSAIPKKHPLEKKERILLKGEIPSAMNPPSGCPFRTRCPFAQPICAMPPPKKTVLDPKTQKNDHEYYCILD